MSDSISLPANATHDQGMTSDNSARRRNNRRDFVKQAAALTGAGYWLGTDALNASPHSGPVPNPETFDRLSKQLHGKLVLPSDETFDRIKRVFYWNPRIESQPVAVVRCGHADDARHAIEFARDHKLQVAVRGGGHSYLAWGSCSGLVIDLSPLNRITIDPDKRLLEAQGGALAGDVARAAGVHGLVPVLGQCPGVGAAGVTLGGGLGWLSGLFGACCDQLHAATIINANAEPMTASDNDDAELLWGLRGAGANFGATTSLRLRLHPIDHVFAGDVHFGVADAQAVLRGFRDVMRQAPDGFQANLNLTQGTAGVFISFCHVASDAQADQMLARIRTIAKPTKVDVKRQPFFMLAEKAAVTNPTNVPPPAFRAIQTVYRHEITDEMIEILVDQLAAATPDAVFGLSHYMHGAVCRVKPDATAFPHRQEHSVHLRVAYNWSDPQENESRFACGERWLQALRPKTNESLYANFQTYETKAGSPSLFGPNHERLLKLKQKHDPANFFRRNANVAKSKA
jgi:FAD/FMN-containing dehydrogenase